METNAAYEELKQTTKSVWEMITSNELFYALILFVVLVILLKIVDIMSRRMKKRGSMLAGFIAGCVKVFLLAAFGMRISSLLPGLRVCQPDCPCVRGRSGCRPTYPYK